MIARYARVVRLVLALSLVAGSLTPVFAADGPPSASHRLNILFLLTDDQRADTIHALGNSVIQTQTLDRLARSGLVFRNCYCMGSDMPAVCFPSRSMLLTGRSLFHLKHKQGGYGVRYPVNFPRDAPRSRL